MSYATQFTNRLLRLLENEQIGDIYFIAPDEILDDVRFIKTLSRQGNIVRFKYLETGEDNSGNYIPTNEVIGEPQEGRIKSEYNKEFIEIKGRSLIEIADKWNNKPIEPITDRQGTCNDIRVEVIANDPGDYFTPSDRECEITCKNRKNPYSVCNRHTCPNGCVYWLTYGATERTWDGLESDALYDNNIESSRDY